MDMQYFWIIDSIKQNQFMVIWIPRQENLADYVTKHHPAAHHRQDRPYYYFLQTTPYTLLRSLSPSVIQGYVNNLRNGYLKRALFPRVIQTAS